VTAASLVAVWRHETLGKKKTKNRRAPAELNEAPASPELVGVYIYKVALYLDLNGISKIVS
jgi:hypothetical protein